MEQGGYAVVGLTAKYWLSRQVELTVVVDNLFDRRFYEGLETVYYSNYGEPHGLSASLKYHF
ncbi:hypothetical protein GCM10007205_22130 [Oxalicibacterium flavum]|uniref:TonB-dependent receptor-like beta-barrel domain-containing protein n=1 Tax=Oxalicibacterium flavum TaxID=179467 RepID=A0A8J2UML7_9BURK|nr:hypothetical protein GCM10007205_22130 [Oxalicibacterium flavum]